MSRNEGSIRKKNKNVILKAAKKEFVLYGYKGASIKRIAERANIPRANIHYYFRNKDALYQQILNDIIDVWNIKFATLNVLDDPKEALSSYINSKVMYSKEEPESSKIFASELLHGAPILKQYLHSEFKQWLESKVAVINEWKTKGLINDVNPYHLLFLIWSSTQHYADYDIQIKAGLNKKVLTSGDFEDISNSLVQIILKGIIPNTN